MPDFTPEEQALFNYLRSHTPAPSGSVPTPANLPRRRPAARTAAEVERAEGLNLNLDRHRASRALRPRRVTPRPRPGTQSLPVWIFNRIKESPAGYGRETAWTLAQAWARTVADREEFTGWSWAVGMSRPDAAAELKDHGFTPDALQTLIQDKPARSLLRTGYDVQLVIYGLYRAAARRQTGP
ncbi:hypothetical protein [Streptomyces yangpuensis]|uniref:hypothetical protein n=1 Tax=Streptomyces yangpuensis TaxID=1648182 RepID=UPI003668860D